tara:strand:- start:58 stop:297 length:240 start_codon:yes stop_codon:yes gene_type:complete
MHEANDSQRIRDLWIKCDQLDSESRELRITARYHLEAFKRAIAIIEENDGDENTIFLLRHVLDGFEDAINRSLDQHKPF